MSARALFSTLTGLRDRILERVRKVNERTAAGALGAGTHLTTVVRTAREHIEQLHQLLVRTHDSSLHTAIAHHADHVREQGAALEQAVAHHAGEVASVASAASAIAKAAREIERMNRSARMLAMNARIESERSGALVFKAIANEMAELSRAIIAANGQVQQLATSMEAKLPRLVADAEALRSTMSTFTQDARSQIAHVDREIADLKSSIEGSLRSSDSALASVIASSNAGLSDLQFQDVCAQSLLQIDTWCEATLRDAATELDVDAEIAPPLQAITQEDEVLDHTTAGEVMMF